MRKSLLASGSRTPAARLGLGYSLTAPHHARIHCLSVGVDYKLSWRKSMQLAGPESPFEPDVMGVEGKFTPPSRSSVETDDIILINYPNGELGWMSALAWATGTHVLVPTIPQEVFAIGINNPSLHTELCPEEKLLMYINATTPCFHHGRMKACGVCYNFHRQYTFLQKTTGTSYQDDWYAFRVKRR